MSSGQTVHIVDDDGLVRHSMELFLAAAGFQIKSYQSAREFLGAVGAAEEGCVVTDVRMPEMSGIELLIEMQQMNLALPVIVISGHADVALAVRAMKQGAVDFIEKPVHADLLVGAVRRAIVQGPGAPRPQAAAADPVADEVPPIRLPTLSDRENEVLNGLLQGKSNKAIGRDLQISERTVESHRAKVMRKTGAGSIAELVRLAMAAAK